MIDKVKMEHVVEPERLEVKFKEHRIKIGILPLLGANLSSFEVDEREFIYFSKEELIEGGEHTGCFNMFPTPCRLQGSKYNFNGKEIRQRKNGEDIFIHGLIRDEEFSCLKTEDTIRCTLEADKNHPVYEGYPFPFRLTFSYTPVENGLEIKFTYENMGDSPSPFGYGLHPFWKIHGRRENVFIKIPCSHIMELADLVPTGKISPVDGTGYDLRTFRSLAEVDIDNVFMGRDITDKQVIEFRDAGIRLTLDASENFTHMIAYTPLEEPFLCMENLTCSPNAPNLYHMGAKHASGLTVVAPGNKIEGWVKYIVENMEGNSNGD